MRIFCNATGSDLFLTASLRWLFLLGLVLVGVGCSWRTGSVADRSIAPLPITLEDNAKIIDLSLRQQETSPPLRRFRLHNETAHATSLYEKAGYIVNEVPWTQGSATNARIRITLHVDDSFFSVICSYMTLYIVPGYSTCALTMVTTGEHRNQSTEHVHTVNVNLVTWLPLLVTLPFTENPTYYFVDSLDWLLRDGLQAMRQAHILTAPITPVPLPTGR